MEPRLLILAGVRSQDRVLLTFILHSKENWEMKREKNKKGKKVKARKNFVKETNTKNTREKLFGWVSHP